MKSLAFWRLGCFLAIAGALLNGTARADIWTSGHGDIGALINDSNQLEVHFHFENDVNGMGGIIPAGEYASGDHGIFVANPSIPRPSGNQWDFLGAPTDDVWFLPQSADPSKPFLGFGLEDLNAGDWSGNLTWSLNSVVSAPAGANFAIWNNNPFGNPIVRATTVDGISSLDSFLQSPGGHEHFNLGFTREGTYQLELQVSGTHNTLGALSDTGTFTFHVGSVTAVPEPTSMILLGSTLGIGGLVGWRKRRKQSTQEPTILDS